ncbi:MAG: DUF4339 domain-containing protein [Rubripirellula sp.]
MDDSEKSTPIEAAQSAARPMTAAVGSAGPVGTSAVNESVATYDSPVANSDMTPASPAGFTTEASGPGTGVQTPEDVNRSKSQPQSSGAMDVDAAAAVLDDDPDATWYVRPPSGGQYGPASGDILRKWIGEGRVASTALLWREGWPQWRDASEALPELGDQLPKSDSSSSSRAAAPQTGSHAASDDSANNSPRFTGEAGVGADRRSRSMRRVLMIGVLTALAATLIGVLVIVINR